MKKVIVFIGILFLFTACEQVPSKKVIETSSQGADVSDQEVSRQNNQEEVISQEEQEFLDSGRAKAIEDESDLWNFKDFEEAGFSIKFPHSVQYSTNRDLAGLKLSVKVDKIVGLEGTMGYNQETAEQNIDALEQGRYGVDVDWPFEDSKQVVEFGDNVSAQEFAVFSRFEVCDVAFERKLLFYHNGYQVLVTLTGDKKVILSENPKFFQVDEMNCGEEIVWNFEQQAGFWRALLVDELEGVAQEWYQTFEEIKDTIVFEESEEEGKELSLQGTWNSESDEKSVIEFTDSEKINFYDGKEMSRAEYDFDGKNLSVQAEDGEFLYSVNVLTAEELELTYLARGNSERYLRK